jgi:cytochrome P450
MTLAEPLAFNPLDPAFRANPYPIYRRLLEEAPVFDTPFGVPAFSRFDDCIAILKDHRHFSSDDRKSPMYGQNLASAREILGADAQVSEDDRPFLFMDPPDHSRLRRLVNMAFTPRAIEALRPRIQELVDELLDAVEARPADAEGTRSMDVIGDLAYPLPVAVICEMLGVPKEDEAQFRTWSRVLASSLDPDIAVPPEVIQQRAEAIKDSRAYFRQLIAKRGSEDRGDILSGLMSASAEGDRLSEGELLSTCTLILIAGHETTVNLIGNGVLQLLRHTEELAKFREQPELARSVVEEVLRFDPPVQFDGRMCTEETEVGGYKVPYGSFVMLLLGAANRDPAKFVEPDRFDITRNDDRHLAFGYGIHFCLGAPLARVEGEIALRTLTQRFKEVRLIDENPPYRAQITLRGMESLRVAF